jgi:protein LTV1
MSSSALHRTEGLTLLDQRFDKIEEEYADDGFGDFPDDASMVSGMSKVSGISKMSDMSKMSQWSSSEAPPLRSDFDGIMDDFLGNHHIQGKRRVKKGKQQSGLEQLDEVRKGLGAARISARTRAAAGGGVVI